MTKQCKCQRCREEGQTKASAQDSSIVVIGPYIDLLRARTNCAALIHADSGQDAVELIEERNIKAAIIEFHYRELEDAKLIARKNIHLPLLFFCTYGNVPLFRQRLDQVGLQSSGITTTLFLMKFAEEIVESLIAGDRRLFRETFVATSSKLDLLSSSLLHKLSRQLELSSCSTWGEFEMLLDDRVEPLGLSIQLTRRTKDRKIDIIGLSDGSEEYKCLLQVQQRANSFIIDPVQSISFFRGWATRSCSAVVGIPAEEEYGASEYCWMLDVWDYEELKNWVLMQGWWSPAEADT